MSAEYWPAAKGSCETYGKYIVIYSLHESQGSFSTVGESVALMILGKPQALKHWSWRLILS